MFSLGQRIGILAIFATTALLCSCGGGGGGASSAATGSTYITGAAGTGLAIANGQVSFKCIGGKSSATSTTSIDGKFNVNAGDLTLPCIGKVVYVDNGVQHQLFTYALNAGNTNITPITDLTVSAFAGSDSAAAFTQFGAASAAPTSTDILNALDKVKTYLSGTLGLDMTYWIENPITDPYLPKVGNIPGDTFDSFLDSLQSKLTNTGQTLQTTTSGLIGNLANLTATQNNSFDVTWHPSGKAFISSVFIDPIINPVGCFGTINSICRTTTDMLPIPNILGQYAYCFQAGIGKVSTSRQGAYLISKSAYLPFDNRCLLDIDIYYYDIDSHLWRAAGSTYSLTNSQLTTDGYFDLSAYNLDWSRPPAIGTCAHSRSIPCPYILTTSSISPTSPTSSSGTAGETSTRPIALVVYGDPTSNRYIPPIRYTELIISGSSSFDSGNAPLTYTWTMVSRPASSTSQILNSTGPVVSFIPDITGNYTISLVVHNGSTDSVPSTLIVAAASQDPQSAKCTNYTVSVGNFNLISPGQSVAQVNSILGCATSGINSGNSTITTRNWYVLDTSNNISKQVSVVFENSNGSVFTSNYKMKVGF